jgi:hypothetical protein
MSIRFEPGGTPPLAAAGGAGPSTYRAADRQKEGYAMSQSASSKGSRIVKVLGIVTLIGVLIAVGRIVLRVFKEKSGEAEDAHDGV